MKRKLAPFILVIQLLALLLSGCNGKGETDTKEVLKGMGDSFTVISDEVIYNRDPSSIDEGIILKGHHFIVSFADSELDPHFDLLL